MSFTLELLHLADQEGGLSAIENAPNLSAVANVLRDQDIGDDGVEDNTLFLSSGDVIIPGLFFDASAAVFGFAGIADVEIQNQLGIEAVAFGNHEFDLGPGFVASLITGENRDDADEFGDALGEILGEEFEGAQFPYLSANLDFSTSEAFAGNGETLESIIVDGAGEPLPNTVTSSVVIDVNGEPIGVVGATTPILGSIASPGDVGVLPMSFDTTPTDAQLDALAAIIQAEVDALIGATPGLNKVILLAHFQQLSIEQAISERLTDVDIIVAGGSNSLLADDDDILRPGDTADGPYPLGNENAATAPEFLDDAEGNPVAIVNTDGNYTYLGRLVVEFDDDGLLVEDSYDPEVSGAFATNEAGLAAIGATAEDVDPEIQQIVDLIEEQIIETESNVFGLSEVFLDGRRSEVRTEETNLGNLTADANLAIARESDESVLVSLKNGGGIRAPIGQAVVPAGGTGDVELLPTEEVVDGEGNVVKPEGGISQTDITNTLAFNNGLTLLTLTPEQLIITLEHAVAATAPGATPGQFAQVGGVNFSFDPDNTAQDLDDDGNVVTAGERIQTVSLVDEEGDETLIYENGEILDAAPSSIRIVTLSFLANGGDGYPYQAFINADPDFANRVDLFDLDGDDEDDDSFTGEATFAPDGTEQDALAEFLADAFPADDDPATPVFDNEETPPALDTRIQNLNFTDPTIADVAAANDSFDILTAALEATGLAAVVDDRAAEFTVFAPTDAGFSLLAEDLGIETEGLDEAAITEALLAALTDLGGSEEAGLDLLEAVLLYHVSPGAQTVTDLQAAGTIATANPEATFEIEGETLIDNDDDIANPTLIEGLTDLAAANGLIQAIDRVLLPFDVPAPVIAPEAPVATGELGEVTEALVLDTGDGEGASEVVVFDDGKIFVTNGAVGAINVFDAASGDLLDTIDLTVLPGFDGVQSVAVKNGLVAAAISTPNVAGEALGHPTVEGQKGFVALIDAETGTVIDRVTVGNLPDMVTFNGDGTKILVANEGEFNGESELTRDPKGSVTIIDVADGAVAPMAMTVDFSAFDGLEEIAREKGIRLAEGASLLRGLEPEYISVEGDTAYVSLQEANAIAVLDIAAGEFTDIIPLGVVDHSEEGFELDPDDDGEIGIRNFDNLVGLRMPDAIDTFVRDGVTYIITANEGDGRGDPTDDPDEVPFPGRGDEASVEDILAGEIPGVSIDPSVDTSGLGELTVSLIDGDTDGDGDIDVLHSFGSRSFTIFDTDGNVVFDSGSQFEAIIADLFPERFNNDDGEPIDEEDDNRSDNKGPEPEAVTVGEIDGELYAFIGLERTSEVLIYNISDVTSPFFVDVIPGFEDPLGTGPEDNVAPETIAFIPAAESASGVAQIAAAYEGSGETVVYNLGEFDGSGGEPVAPLISEFQPNPSGEDPSTQTVELSGEAGTSFNDWWLVSIESDAGSNPGLVDRAEGFSGTFDANGLFTIEVPDLENPSFTYVLSAGFTGTVGETDFDADDDGVADQNLDAFGTVLDAVGIVDETGEPVYGAQLGGTDIAFSGDEPRLAFRDASRGEWYVVNDPAGGEVFDEDGSAVDADAFDTDPTAGTDTFGAINPTLEDGNGGPTARTIPEIQGAGHLSPFEGETVVTSGIVTAVDFSGYYLQDPEGDGDIATSDGIFVETDFGAAPGLVAVGDEVEVTGTVVEDVPGGVDTGNLSITQIVADETMVLSSGNPLPAAEVIGSENRLPPPETLITDELPINLVEEPGDFDPETDAIDFFESIEGMRVTVDDPAAVQALNRFDEFNVLADGGEGSPTPFNDRGGININNDPDGRGDLNYERIQIAYDAFFDLVDAEDVPFDVTVGDALSDITGVVSYSFGNYEVLVTEGFEVEEPSGLEQEVTEVAGGDDRLSVVTYNILNVTGNTEGPEGDDQADPDDDDDAEQIERIAEQIVENLGSPDIVALQEVQDDSGEDDDGTLSADGTLQAIVDAIAAAGGPTYAFVSAEVDVDGETGGVPGGNIRNAFLWNPERTELTGVETLEFGNEPGDPFFETRDPLLGTFSFNGEEVTVINNHFSSRFGSTPIFGAVQPFIQAGEADRAAQAQAVNTVVDGILAEDPDAKVVVLGDLNTFENTDELTEDLAGTGDEEVLTNLIFQVPEGDRYTFNFEGNSQVLDHIFVTDGLLEGALVDIVHTNVDFPEDGPLFASDHEPVIASFLIESMTVAISGTGGDDDLVGTAGSDNIAAAAGNDTLAGEGGNDTLAGGEGDDLARGGEGDDLVLGLAGSDTLLGNEGEDRLFGGEGDDFVGAGAGDDIVLGEGGDDQLSGGEGDDNVSGGDGDDTAFGGEGGDSLFAGEGDDLVLGGDDDDFLAGNAGADRLFGGEGDDTVNGNQGDDVVFGQAGDDALAGGVGEDTLLGGEGDDTFDGGAGDDELGGSEVGDGEDVFFFSGAFGDDIVFAFESGVDTLEFEGVDADDITAAPDGSAIEVTVSGDTTFGTVRLANTSDILPDDIVIV